MKRWFRRRAPWAFLASLALHAALALLVWVAPSERAPKTGPQVQAIELELVELPAPVERATAAPEPKPAEQKPAVTRPSAAARTPSEAQPASPEKAATTGAPAPDAPRKPSLLPSSEFEIAVGARGVDPEPARGHTVVNSEQERPDAVAMREYTEEQLGRKTSALVEGMVATAQAKNGLVDPYFAGARTAMEGALSQGPVPLPKGKDVFREGFKGLVENQARFGKTGNPFAPGQEPKWDDYSLARSENTGVAMQGRDPAWAAINRQAEQSMAAQEATLRMADRAWVEAIIELVQEASGAITDAHIVKSSGFRDFDEYVLHRARKVFLKLEDPPQSGHGISGEGWRTLWKFSYYPVSLSDRRGQRVRVELLRVQKGQGDAFMRPPP